ncbi:hypothetical protein TcCL_NonESM10344 [Trypanosoma cruzi]|nr:hypothetical protein TcCL_NonESM10344 [Trypanosoma cruzi]
MLLASALFLTIPQLLLLLFSLLMHPQARHDHFNTRPSSTRRCHALPLRRKVHQLLPVKRLRVLYNRQHAPAAQHTQRHNVVPPPISNRERNTQRVPAHAPHALQPQADQVGRHQLRLVFLLQQTLSPSQSTVWVP